MQVVRESRVSVRTRTQVSAGVWVNLTFDVDFLLYVLRRSSHATLDFFQRLRTFLYHSLHLQNLITTLMMIDVFVITIITNYKVEKLVDRGGRVYAFPPNPVSVSYDLDLWPLTYWPQSWLCHVLAVWITCATWSHNGSFVIKITRSQNGNRRTKRLRTLRLQLTKPGRGVKTCRFAAAAERSRCSPRNSSDSRLVNSFNRQIITGSREKSLFTKEFKWQSLG